MIEVFTKKDEAVCGDGEGVCTKECPIYEKCKGINGVFSARILDEFNCRKCDKRVVIIEEEKYKYLDIDRTLTDSLCKECYIGELARNWSKNQ